MTRLKALAGVLLAVALVSGAGFASPAQAATAPPAGCTAKWPPIQSIFTFNFTGSVYYNPNGANEDINALGFLVSGSHTGGKSDVEWNIKENGALRQSGHTPDNLQHNQLFVQPIGVTVAAASIAQAWFHPAFDIAGPDPHCDANTSW